MDQEKKETRNLTCNFKIQQFALVVLFKIDLLNEIDDMLGFFFEWIGGTNYN